MCLLEYQTLGGTIFELLVSSQYWLYKLNRHRMSTFYTPKPKYLWIFYELSVFFFGNLRCVKSSAICWQAVLVMFSAPKAYHSCQKRKICGGQTFITFNMQLIIRQNDPKTTQISYKCICLHDHNTHFSPYCPHQTNKYLVITQNILLNVKKGINKMRAHTKGKLKRIAHAHIWNPHLVSNNVSHC